MSIAATPSLELELESHRRELTGYCYRMLGSWFEAEDAVQETMVRAWRKNEDLQARGAFKSWLYRIATNVSLDMLQGAKRRALAMDMGPSQTTADGLGPLLGEEAWLEPAPDAGVLPERADPAELAAQRETLRLAFVAALQHLPPRQRAVLILRDVLRWQASEVADLLETTTVSVNSALQRARATLDELQLQTTGATQIDDDAKQELLERYMKAFERYDMVALVALLREDAEFSMPPFNMWLQGPDEIVAWMLGPGHGCRGSRTIAVWANGGPAYAQYKPDPEGGHAPWSITTLEIDGDGLVCGVHNFLALDDPKLFTAFGVPTHLP